MPEPISLALGTKEIMGVLGLLIGGNAISFKYIISGKLKQIDKLGDRVTKVEEHRWAELNRIGTEVHDKLDRMNGRIDEIYKLLTPR